MSPYLPQAVISIEDRRFYYHFGFDPIGLARAVVTNLVSGHTVQGGSTLTQQLAKNLFLTPERTMERKVQEVLLAIWLEHKFTKDEILAMYLNRVYFGANAYGVEAAARRYYNKSARDLDLMEAATIAGLLKAPSRLSPAKDPAAAKARAEVVLGAMRDAGYINEKQVQSALAQTPDPARPYLSSAGQYVADMVMDKLHDMVGDVKEDLIVDTTIDPALETEAGDVIRNAINKEGKRLNVTQGALVAIDGTGAIRALVGGKDYAESQYDRAYKALRQPGSAFKPFVYAAALEQGATPDSVRNDAPVRIGDWTPENYEKRYNGPSRSPMRWRIRSTRLRPSSSWRRAPAGDQGRASHGHRGRSAAECVDCARYVGSDADGPDGVLRAVHEWRLQGDTACRAPYHDRQGQGALREYLRRAAACSRTEYCRHDERHDDACRQRGHGQGRKAFRLAGCRQDRHDAILARCALCRIYVRHDDRRMVRQ